MPPLTLGLIGTEGGILSVLSVKFVFLVFLGSVAGLFVGAIPGLSVSMATALLVSIAYT
ncbi:MAG: hypothetical protein PUH70_06790 [Clostridiales bacterium]|nr:hypothetical protein [Clostridiales bacterium]MDY5348933.1 hypothetical protein [Candidatus Ventricola sp.]